MGNEDKSEKKKVKEVMLRLPPDIGEQWEALRRKVAPLTPPSWAFHRACHSRGLRLIFFQMELLEVPEPLGF